MTPRFDLVEWLLLLTGRPRKARARWTARFEAECQRVYEAKR